MNRQNHKGLVFDIDRFSTHDGPGIRAAIFLKGCPLSCKWCHSPESQKNTIELLYQKLKCRGCFNCVDACPRHLISPCGITGLQGHSGIHINKSLCLSCFKCADACSVHALRPCGKIMGADEIVDIVVQDKPYYDNTGGGITVTGGEPLSQPDFTLELLYRCKKKGIHTAIETCGFGNGKSLLLIAGQCGLIYYDIKILNDVKHREYTGVSNRLILDNLKLLCHTESNRNKIIIRMPCVPGINDGIEQIRETAAYVKGLGLRSMETLPYNEMAGAKYDWLQLAYGFNGLKPRPKNYYKRLAGTISDVMLSENFD